MSIKVQEWEEEGCRRLVDQCRNLGLFAHCRGAVVERHAGRARRSSAWTLRVTLGESEGDIPILSAKILARSPLYLLSRIVDAQTRLSLLGSFRVPKLQAYWEDADYIFLVEDFIPDATSLGRLVANGVLEVSNGREILGMVASGMYRLQVSDPVATDQGEIDGLLRAISEVPLPREQRDRLMIWTEANLSILRHPAILTNRDLTSGNVLRAPSGSDGMDEWWLVDFDLAAATTFFWRDCLRSGHITGWGIPFWDPAWGRPDGIAYQALNWVLEWDLQRHCVEMDDDSFAQIRPLQAACDNWDIALCGRTSELSSSLIERREGQSPRDDFQLFWDRGFGFLEENSAMLVWRADSVLGSHTFSLPKGIPPRAFRLDPAAGPCGVLIYAIIFHGEDGAIHVDLASMEVKGDAFGAVIEKGFLVASIGPDPQIILQVPLALRQVLAVTVAGVKSPGLDRELIERLANSNQCPIETMLPLVQEHHAQLSGKVIALEHQVAVQIEALAEVERSRTPALAAVQEAICEMEAMRTDQGRCIAQVEVTLNHAWPLFRSLAVEQQRDQHNLMVRMEALSREAERAAAASRDLKTRLAQAEARVDVEHQRAELAEASTLALKVRVEAQLVLEMELRHQIDELRQSVVVSRADLDRAERTRIEIDGLLAQAVARVDVEHQRAELAEASTLALKVRVEAQLVLEKELRHHLDNLHQSSVVLRADLDLGSQSQQRLEGLLSEASARADEDRRRRDDLQDRHDALTRQHSSLINLRSWRITGPLRWLKSLFTR